MFLPLIGASPSREARGGSAPESRPFLPSRLRLEGPLAPRSVEPPSGARGVRANGALPPEPKAPMGSDGPRVQTKDHFREHNTQERNTVRSREPNGEHTKEYNRHRPNVEPSRENNEHTKDINLNSRDCSKEPRKCTKFCEFWIKNGRCQRNICNFAHSLEEYKPQVCRFDNRCKYINTCQYKHTCETSLQMIKRLNIQLDIHTSQTVKAVMDSKATSVKATDKEESGETSAFPTSSGSAVDVKLHKEYTIIRNLKPLKECCKLSTEKGFEGDKGKEIYSCETSREMAVKFFTDAVEGGYKNINIKILT